MNSTTNKTENRYDLSAHAPKWAHDSPNLAEDKFPEHDEQGFPEEDRSHARRVRVWRAGLTGVAIAALLGAAITLFNTEVPEWSKVFWPRTDKTEFKSRFSGNTIKSAQQPTSPS